MADASRSSGVLTGSDVVAAHQCRLKSIHFCTFAGGPDVITIKVYDSEDSTLSGNTELARFVVAGPSGYSNVEYDMHGVLCREGIYLQIANSEGSPNAATFHAVSIEFN